MRHDPSNDFDDDFMVEITSLDTPGTPVHAHDEVLQGSRVAPRVRTWLTTLSVVGGLLLIFMVLSPFLSSLLSKKTSTSPTFYLPPTQIEDVTVQNGIAYITSSDGTLRALRIKNGSLLWQRNAVEGVPFFINGRIYIDYYSSQKSTVQALRAIDGSVLWTFKTSLDISPLIIDNGVVHPLFQFLLKGHILTVLDGSNGDELWHYAVKISQLQGAAIQEMQNKIYITTWANAQNPNTDLFVLKMSDGTLLWHTTAANIQLTQSNLVCIMTNAGIFVVLRADNGHEVWHYKSSDNASLSPLTGDKIVYMQTPEGVLQALRADNGALLWTYKDPWGIAEDFSEVNGVLYLETGNNFIVALRTSDGARLWHVQPATSPFTSSSVQVEGGIVYTFTAREAQNETIAALRTSNGSILWRQKLGASDSNMLPHVINGQLLPDSSSTIIVDTGSSITVLRVGDGAVLWHAGYVQTTLQYSSGFFALADDIMILRSSGSALEAHQLETGAVLWRYPRGNS